MNIKLLYKQIKAAISCQDQLVFTYQKDPATKIVRFVTPLEFVVTAKVDEKTDDTDIKVFCAQHLPKEGYRYFFLHKIEAFKRVMTRDAFANSSFFIDEVGVKNYSSEVS